MNNILVLQKVPNKERNEQMHSLNKGIGQDSNFEDPEERPIPQPLSYRIFPNTVTQFFGIVFNTGMMLSMKEWSAVTHAPLNPFPNDKF